MRFATLHPLKTIDDDSSPHVMSAETLPLAPVAQLIEFWKRMMKPIMNGRMAISVALFFSAPNVMAADCLGTRLNQQQIRAYLGDSLICAYKAGAVASDPNQRWSEEHVGSSGGQLFEYGRGANSSIAPRKNVGSWAVSNVAGIPQVAYTYTGDGIYNHTIFNNSGTHQFCEPTTNSPQQVAIVYQRVNPIPSDKTPTNPCNWP